MVMEIIMRYSMVMEIIMRYSMNTGPQSLRLNVLAIWRRRLDLIIPQALSSLFLWFSG